MLSLKEPLPVAPIPKQEKCEEIMNLYELHQHDRAKFVQVIQNPLKDYPYNIQDIHESGAKNRDTELFNTLKEHAPKNLFKRHAEFAFDWALKNKKYSYAEYVLPFTHMHQRQDKLLNALLLLNERACKMLVPHIEWTPTTYSNCLVYFVNTKKTTSEYLPRFHNIKQLLCDIKVPTHTQHQGLMLLLSQHRYQSNPNNTLRDILIAEMVPAMMSFDAGKRGELLAVMMKNAHSNALKDWIKRDDDTADLLSDMISTGVLTDTLVDVEQWCQARHDKKAIETALPEKNISAPPKKM